MNKSAVLYDYMQVRGGAESVTLTMCNEMPELDLVTAFMAPEAFTEAPIAKDRIKTLISPTTRPGWQVFKGALAFEYKTAFLRDYQSLIFSGSLAPLAVKHSRAAKNVYYCHTPPRFVYDLKDYYLDIATRLERPALKALIAYLQPRYEEAIEKMDVVFANSKNVQGRLKRYLGLDAHVLYPPVDQERFKWLSDGDYFLSTARLEPLKRVDLIVEAFTHMPDKKLIVTSGGSQLQALRKLAADSPNIEFTGWVDDYNLTVLVGKCKATLYIPRDEDFGISPIQSLAAGKPVIGVKEGGVTETVLDGKTGILLPESPSPSQVCDAVVAIEKLAFQPNQQLDRFTTEEFMESIVSALC